MVDIDDSDTKVSRREVFGLGSTALAAATLAVTGGKDADAQTQRLPSHNAPNETDPGPQNLPLAVENPDSEWSPSTDSGTGKPFKYSFALARKRVERGGWTRQGTSRELAVSTTMPGVEMRLTAGGVRELHWHVEAEWAITMKPTKVARGGEVKIIDSKIFPVTPISSAIVTLKPGGLRELHWHPNADEWQYYISGKGRMTVFGAG